MVYNNMLENSVREKKDIIRKEIIRLLQGQDLSLREERSSKIAEKLLSCEEYKASQTVMTYVALPLEVNTDQIIKKALEHGKRVVVPFIEPDSQTITASELSGIECLEKGPLGIFQPKEGSSRSIPLKEIDLVVVPAIAYDQQNIRLGRGKGYYDRFLASDDLSSAKVIGLAFHFQILDCLPSDPHDKPVQRVITD